MEHQVLMGVVHRLAYKLEKLQALVEAQAVLVAVGRNGLYPPSSRLSQARAMRQSLETVPWEIPRTSAVSSMFRPAK